MLLIAVTLPVTSASYDFKNEITEKLSQKFHDQ